MLAYLYILLMFILLPVRMVFCFILQVFWSPSFKYGLTLKDANVSDEEYTRVLEQANLELDEVANDGDGPKFLALYHVASRYFPDITPTDHTYKFYHKDETFKRYEKLEDNIGEPTPSGDMMAGYLIARAADTANKINTNASDYVSIVKNIIHAKIPFMIDHPNGEMWMRGFIWPAWGDGADVLETVAMIDSAIETQKLYDDKFDWNLNIMKWLILVTNFPLWIWNYDSAFFMGNKFFLKWFMSHSRMMFMTAGHMLTGAWYYKMVAKKIYNRYGKISPDVAYMYKFFFDNKADVSHANYMINSYVSEGKGTEKYTGPTDTYINLEKFFTYPFKKEDFRELKSSMITPAKNRCETYIWERDPLKIKTCGKPKTIIDLVFVLAAAKYFQK